MVAWAWVFLKIVRSMCVEHLRALSYTSGLQEDAKAFYGDVGCVWWSPPRQQ